MLIGRHMLHCHNMRLKLSVSSSLLDDCSRGLFQPALQPSETACQSLRRSHSCLIASTHQCEQRRPVVKLSSCAGHPEWYTCASQNLPGVCGPVPGSGTTQGHRCPSRVREAARAVGGVRQRGRPGAVPAGVFAESSCCLMLQSPSNCCTQEADALDFAPLHFCHRLQQCCLTQVCVAAFSGADECAPLQVSFANSICTTKGGTHVDLITNQICK